MITSSGPKASQSDQLTGWKEISAYIGKGVRQAQRWEKLGMPVHRVGGMDGVVYAFRAEIDGWRTSSEGRQAEGAEPQTETELTIQRPLVAADAVPLRRDPMRRVWLFSILALLLGAGAVIAQFVQPMGLIGEAHLDGHVDRVRTNGSFLEALDSVGTVLWRYDLGYAGTIVNFSGSAASADLAADLDGDGRNEVVVAVAHGADQRDVGPGHLVYAFSPEGVRLWEYSEPDVPFVFDGQKFDGPTRVLAWTSDDEGNVWLSMNHHTWWPTMLVRVDPKGRAELRYVQSGGIYALSPWRRRDGRTYIVATGVNNEYREASVAIIDSHGPPAVSPQSEGSGFHCDNCPAGSVVGFFSFPRSDVGKSDGANPYSIIRQLNRVGDGIRVYVPEGPSASPLAHIISPDLGVYTMEPSDLYRHEHERLEREGRLDHSFISCPDRAKIAKVRVWRRSTGWTLDSSPDMPSLAADR